MSHDYFDNSILIHEDYSMYEETQETLFEGLEEQAEPEEVSEEDLLQDEMLEIPESVFEGEVSVEPINRYRISDMGESRVVYVFDHSLGTEVVGDYAMIRTAMPDYIPDEMIPMSGRNMAD